MRPRTAILVAVAVYFTISWFVPFGTTLLYPLTLFTTWVHEMGHGLMGLIMGGEFKELVIRGDGSGQANTYAAHGWPDAFVCSAGILTPALVGSIILATVHGPRRARVALGFLAAALVLSLMLYVRSTAGLIAMPLVAVALAYAAWQPNYRVVIAQFLAVILALETVTDGFAYALSSEARKGEKSDVQLIADQLGGSHWMWGLAIIAISLLLLGTSLWWAWRVTGRQAATAAHRSSASKRPGPAADRSRSPAARA